jgi:hypothetical protein
MLKRIAILTPEMGMEGLEASHPLLKEIDLHLTAKEKGIRKGCIDSLPDHYLHQGLKGQGPRII